jgi:hypothetical protein
MIPIVLSALVSIANGQARQSAAQAVAQSQNAQSSQTVQVVNSSQSHTAQKPEFSSEVCSAPSYITITKTMWTVTLAVLLA